MNVGSGQGIAVREFQTASGPVDYALFVDRRLCGVIEAKPEGRTLSGFPVQAERYMAGAPEYLVREAGQVRFEYVASPTEILFRDHADPAPCLASGFRLPSSGDALAMAEGARDAAAPAPVHAAPEPRGPPRLPGRGDQRRRSIAGAKPSPRACPDGDRRRQNFHRRHTLLPTARARRLPAHPVPRRPCESRTPDSRRISRLSAAGDGALVCRTL